MDSHERPVCADEHRRTHTVSHRRPVCDGRHPETSCVYSTDSPRGQKSPELSTGRVSVLSPRTNVLICVLMDSHGRPVCADGHTQTHTDSHRRPVCADGHKRKDTDSHRRPVCTDQTAHVGQNHPNSPREGPAC
ncbi:unnamed protein product [Brassica rapa]|uniref:Uncharacterized protein n=1 Tax=Brassica campestris TaxID=3711 RepID=A0A8D9D7T3_BRACM|nr:unnamed protein product [Brassica rapa]